MKPRPLEWYCGATMRQTEGTCHRRAGQGTNHLGVGRCNLHGGATPSHERAGARALAERDARSFLANEGVAPVTDPLGALFDHVAQVKAFYEFVRDKVGGLDVDAWENVPGEDNDGRMAQLSVYVGLLERAQERTQRALAELVKLGLEERLVRITERQAEMIVRVIDGALEAVGMSDEQRSLARAEVPRRLEEMSGKVDLDRQG
jgi:hypothetical protein